MGYLQTLVASGPAAARNIEPSATLEQDVTVVVDSSPASKRTHEAPSSLDRESPPAVTAPDVARPRAEGASTPDIGGVIDEVTRWVSQPVTGEAIEEMTRARAARTEPVRPDSPTLDSREELHVGRTERIETTAASHPETNAARSRASSVQAAGWFRERDTVASTRASDAVQETAIESSSIDRPSTPERETKRVTGSERPRSVDVRIGSISFTVKAPSAPPPASAKAAPSQPVPASRAPPPDGFRFSTSRHYLRRS